MVKTKNTLLSHTDLVKSYLDIEVLGQVMTKNSDSQDEYLAKIRNVCNGSAEDLELYEAIANFCRQTNDRKRRLAFVPLFKKIEKLRGLKKLAILASIIMTTKIYCRRLGKSFTKSFPLSLNLQANL